MTGDRAIGCVLVNHFRARLELARRPELADCPGLVVDRSRRHAVVVDHLPLAARLSVGPRWRCWSAT